MLDWRSVTSSSDPKFWVRGTVLSRAYVPGTLSRFVIVEVRAYVGGHADRYYALEDAATVTDADVREGKTPKKLGRYETIEAAIAAAKAAP